MEKSIKNAFTFMFEDKDWKYKLFVLSALAFPSFYLNYQGENLKQSLAVNAGNIFSLLWFILLMLIFIIYCTFLFEGYCCKCTQNIIFSNENTTQNDLLPEWENNFWGFSKIGILFSVGVGLLGLVVALASILIIPIFLYLFAYVALKTLFCIDFKIGAFFAWGKAKELIGLNSNKYWSVILSSFGVYFAFGIIAFICSKSLVLVFLGAFAQAYVFLVMAYLRGTLLDASTAEALSSSAQVQLAE